MSSLKLFHSWDYRRKNVLLKLTVCFTIFFAVDLVWIGLDVGWIAVELWCYDVSYLGENPFTIF